LERLIVRHRQQAIDDEARLFTYTVQKIGLGYTLEP